jgi:predicted dehydrogenase
MRSPLILDMSIHHFDMLRFMIGADPVAVYTKEFNPDGSWYQGNASTTWFGDWRIVGQQGALLYEKDEPPHGEVVAAHLPEFLLPMKPLEVAPSPLTAFLYHGALREMLEYLRSGKLPQTEAHDNVKSLAMVLAAVESARSGQRVLIDYTL